MTAHALPRAKTRRGQTAVLTGPFLLVVLMVAATAGCVSYLLWPTWPSGPADPRALGTQPLAGPDGLAVLPFRSGTPYDGEDLVYPAANPGQFFARCTHSAGGIPGTCISERALDGAQITVRFPRNWLNDWRSVAAGFDRLTAQLR